MNRVMRRFFRSNSKKKMLTGVIFLLAVAFATVATTLYINGNATIASDSSDFDVKFTKAVRGETDITSTAISADGKSITYDTDELQKKDNESVLTYTVTNNSTLYDATVSVNCTDGTHSDLYSVTNSLESSVPAKTSKDGTITVKLLKDAEEELSEEFTCTLTAEAQERDTVAEDSSSGGGGTAFSVGDTFKIDGEEFYVIEDSAETDSTVTGLAKYGINLSEMKQSANNATWVKFSQSYYWKDYGLSYPANLFDPSQTNSAAYYANQYVKSLSSTAISGMLTYSQASALGCAYQNCDNPADFLKIDNSYWLSTVYWDESVYYLGRSSSVSYVTYSDSNFVRPTITIKKSELGLPTVGNGEARNSNIVSVMNFDKDSCVTGDESTCTTIETDNATAYNSDLIVKYKVNSSTTLNFNVLKDNGSTLTLQQSTDTVSSSAWATSGSTENGPTIALAALDSATMSWSNVNPLTYSIGDDSTTLGFSACSAYNSCSETHYSLTKSGARARMATVQELVEASNGGNLQIPADYGGAMPKWMSGTYWTMTSNSSGGTAWYVFNNYNGLLTYAPVSDKKGIRAVIEIDK